ncbi:MAG: hypothetical protein R3D02_10455 [Hyphomicrobiales bacterium]
MRRRSARPELYMTSGRTNAIQAIAEAYAKANLGRYAETVRVVAQVVDEGETVQVCPHRPDADVFRLLHGRRGRR